jgi:hypothetical protein
MCLRVHSGLQIETVSLYRSILLLNFKVLCMYVYVCIYLLQLDPSPVAELHRH